jgi:hypothetical protein
MKGRAICIAESHSDDLANNVGKMERSRLRSRTGMRYSLLNPLLEELAREGRVKMTIGKRGDLISLIVR